MPRIEQSVTIEAPIEAVWAVARDVEAFPQFMADLQSLKVVERSADGLRTVTEWVGVINAFKMKVKWTQEDLWDQGAYRDTFHMLHGDMDRMEGTWQFVSEGAALTRFDSVVDYEYNVPMVGPMVKGLVKKLMTENLRATLNAIKSRAENRG
jgi:uncharacterized membrane protein